MRNFFFLQFYVSNLISCQLGDSDVIFVRLFLKIKRILYIASGSVPSVSMKNSE